MMSSNAPMRLSTARIFALVALWIVLAMTVTATGEELSESTLEKIKNATTRIVVHEGAAETFGTGFLFLKRNTTGYIITCEHVVRNAGTAQVVFYSGGKSEKSYEAKVVAADPQQDLACLIVKDASDLPSPLEIGEKTGVKETQAVYVGGFPWGKSGAEGKKNPEISITKVTVSSIRKDPKGCVTAVQLSGDLDTGNNGGPVVDSHARVIGVAQKKVPQASMCFAAPPEAIRAFLKGRVKSCSVKTLSAEINRLKLEVTAELIDPLCTLKGIGFAYIAEDNIKDQTRPNADGSWNKLDNQMKTGSLTATEDVARGTFESRRSMTDPTGLTLWVQVFYTTPDGAILWTEPAAVDVEFLESAADGEEPSGGKKWASLDMADEIPVVATLKLGSVIEDMFLSPDGAYIYALDLSEAKVYKLDSETLQISMETKTIDNPVGLALAPNGKTLYVVARDPAARADWPKGSGTIQVISASAMKTTSTFNLDLSCVDVAATDSGILAVTILAGYDMLAIVDANKKALSGIVKETRDSSYVHIHPDQTRVYCGEVGTTGPDFVRVPLRKDPKTGYRTYESRRLPDDVLGGGDFRISPDGRFMAGWYGVLLRLSRAQEADFKVVGKFDWCVALAFGRDCSTLFTASGDGVIKAYDLGTLELKNSANVGKLCTNLLLDPAKKRLYAVVSPVVPHEPKLIHMKRPKPTPGDIVAFLLSGK